MNPFATKKKIPTLADIQSRLAYVSCVQQLEEVKNMEGCFYLRPPIESYKTLDFHKFKEIVECGYNYGREIVQFIYFIFLIFVVQLNIFLIIK